MQMLYNSDSYTVVQFTLDAEQDTTGPLSPAGPAGQGESADPARGQGAEGPWKLVRGGFEIVDKSARKGIYLEGALADSFRRGVQHLVDQGPDAEALDEFISGFTQLAQQPLVLH